MQYYCIDKDNYDACISNVFSKVVERIYILYSLMEDYLHSTHTKFGFKQTHGTEMCVFV